MAGYSATPLQKKLGITERSRIVIEDLPDDVDLEIPVGASVLTSGRGATDVIVAFFRFLLSLPSFLVYRQEFYQAAKMPKSASRLHSAIRRTFL